MNSPSTRLLYRFSPVLSLFALSIGAECSPEGSDGQNVAHRESNIKTPIGYPGNINTPDFNHDGAPDIAVINFLNDTFAVRINNGNGTFGPVTRYPVGQQPSFIARADFNGDGHLDVASCNAISNDVSVLLGNGDGTFKPARHFPLADASQGLFGLAVAPFSIVAGDFNHDGKADLAAANSVTNNISTLLGNGNGTFKPARTFSLLSVGTLGGIPFATDLADFNEDGHFDLVTGGATTAVVLRGNGNGGFVPYAAYNTGIAMSCLQVADFDKDGHIDIAADHWSANYATLMGKGNGYFTVKERKPSGGLIGQCFSVGDLNGDSKQDMAIVNTLSSYGTGNVAIFLGNGDGTFGDPVGYPVGQTPWASSIVDLDKDGKADVAVANGLDTTVSVLFGNGDGTLQPEIRYPM